MKAFQLIINGNWAHFKKPDTNNNPLTHDFITKTAFIGLIGAVIGINRNEMKFLFPKLCTDLLYGVNLLKPVKKEAWGFTLRKAVNLLEKAPKSMEFLKQPDYLVSIALKNNDSEQEFNAFTRAIKSSESKFTPVLGLHNCPANLYYYSEGDFSEVQNGKFTTKCFVSKNHRIVDLAISNSFRFGLDKIPTFQNNDFWNLPDKYIEVIYPSGRNIFTVEGEHYIYHPIGDCWWLI